MRPESLQDLLDTVEDPVAYFRNLDIDTSGAWRDLPDEYTHWIEEQRAWRESCVLMDQSYHMANLYTEAARGPDSAGEGHEAIDFFSHLGVNSMEDFRTGDPPQAKQLVMVNPDGYMIADCTLFYLDENTFLTAGTDSPQNWIQYNAETGAYDVSTDRVYSPFGDGEPADFRFEIMGPHAMDLVADLTDGEFQEISFFEMDTVRILGHEVYALGHQMSGERGLELFGPYEYHDEIKSKLLEAGATYGIRQLGSKSYKSTSVESGWIPVYVPAIYRHEELEGYREWLGPWTHEANLAIGGSFAGDDISEYYVTPAALGYEHIVNFDHEFIGRTALADRLEDPERTRVTLVWDDEAVIDVYASLFREGASNQFIELPDPGMSAGDVTRYDTVKNDGEMVGVATWPGYDYNEREMLSLCCIDVEYSDPGTEVTLVWGEEGTAKSRVPRHREREIRATVAPAPYVRRGRQDP